MLPCRCSQVTHLSCLYVLHWASSSAAPHGLRVAACTRGWLQAAMVPQDAGGPHALHVAHMHVYCPTAPTSHNARALQGRIDCGHRRSWGVCATHPNTRQQTYMPRAADLCLPAACMTACTPCSMAGAATVHAGAHTWLTHNVYTALCGRPGDVPIR